MGRCITTMTAKHFQPDRMKLAEKGRKAASAFARSFRRHTVHLAAITGGEHQRFLENPFRTQFFGGAASLVSGERDPFAHLHGCGAVIQSNENNLHSEAL